MSDYNHILPEKRYQADLDNNARIAIIKRDIWIPTKKLDQLFTTIDFMVGSEGRLVNPSMLVWGAGGSGKSAIIERIKHIYSTRDMKINSISAGMNLDSSQLVDLICNSFGISTGAGRQSLDRTTRVFNTVRAENIVALLMDELNDSGLRTLSQQKNSMSLMKFLSGPPCFLSIICFGDLTAAEVLMKDEQIYRRYVHWPLTPWTNDQDFCNFLATYESHLPLKLPSNICCSLGRSRIMKQSFGIMDNVVKIVKCLAYEGVLNGSERMDVDLVNNDVHMLCMRYGEALRRRPGEKQVKLKRK
ncbi:TniB family NTP-binding protein [Pseudomonas sp. A014]|uniref:TniB family NTP-binding protein n=1 Tax=Pseudomonas sp. A014 TaxID=3458058 RepID=UPI004035F3DD